MAIFLVQEWGALRVVDLPGDLAGLSQNDAAELGVSHSAHVGSLINEPFAARVDHDAVEIVVTLEHGAVSELVDIGCIQIPAR